MIIKIESLKCKICGHRWVPRKKEIRICPKCKETIDYLETYIPLEHCFQLRIVDDKPLYRDMGYSEEDEISETFVCPECSEELFDDPEKAVAFLKGVTDEKLL